MVFFQALLLLGYLYAHYVSTRFEPKRQWALHTIVLLVPIFAMGLVLLIVGLSRGGWRDSTEPGNRAPDRRSWPARD